MPAEIAPDVRKRITEASDDLLVAQREVERAMLELTANAARSEKTIITEVLKVAFEKVAAARSKLDAVTRGSP